MHISADAGRGGGWAEQLPLTVEQRGPLTLDLRDLNFVEPLFVLRLAGALDVQSAGGRPVEVLAPIDRDVANYMARIGVGRGTPASCRLTLPSVLARDRRDVLVELRRLTDLEQVDPLAEEFADLLRAHLTGELQGAADAFVLALSELCDNALTHGQSTHGGYVCAQRYQRRRCVLAIGDLGMGIPRHLRRSRRNLLDDGPAIAAAMERGISGTIDPERGEGYAALIEVLGRAALPYARLRVWSSAGRLELTFRPDRPPQQSARTVLAWTPGTWVELDIRAD